MEMSRSRWINIALLILAGEAIFLLPFVLVRIFRPTFLKVLDINNTELGWCFSTYGLVALVSYFFGGFIADRMSPRKLIAIALLATAAGGFYLSTSPGANELVYLYGYWGMTTILLFWAPLIKATRTWGAAKQQGLAFGLLEGGRGAIAAIIGLVGIAVFSSVAGEDTINPEERLASFQRIIWTTSSVVAFAGVLVWFFMTDKEETTSNEPKAAATLDSLLSSPKLWLIMLVVMTGYVGYKITDFFPQYATDIMKMNEITAGQMGTALIICRPVTAILIGLWADRFTKSRLIAFFFLLMIVEAALFSSGIIIKEFAYVFTANMLITGILIYAVRALYFSLIEEAKFPLATTGRVVGSVSIIGYTPDIFVGPVSGYYLDIYQGLQGFQYIFLGLALCATLGAVASFLFWKIAKA